MYVDAIQYTEDSFEYIKTQLENRGVRFVVNRTPINISYKETCYWIYFVIQQDDCVFYLRKDMYIIFDDNSTVMVYSKDRFHRLYDRSYS